MTTQSSIDLNTCVPGQQLKLRNGNIIRYEYRNEEESVYPHNAGGYVYTDDGHYYSSGEDDEDDVVKIIPFKGSTVLTEQIDVPNPDYVSIIPYASGVIVSIKKGKTTINWRCNTNV